MFNFHVGAFFSSISLFLFHNPTHVVVVAAQIVLLCISFILLITTLIRFIINFRKSSSAYYNSEIISLD